MPSPPDDLIPPSHSPVEVGRLRHVKPVTIRLPLEDLPTEFAGLRIVHIGDTHFRDDWEAVFDAALDAVEASRPHLILHSGDWVDDRFDYRPGLPLVRRFARRLAAPMGVWSCLGNHDGDLLAPHLIDLGIRVLIGESARLSGENGTLELIGLPGVARVDVTDAVLDALPLPGNALRIVLCHYPDVVRRAARLKPHLFLAGHTHGGQLCLPGGRALITHDSLPKSMAAGLHRINSTYLHVTRGLGWTVYPARTWCPAEVTTIELVGGPEPESQSRRASEPV